MVPRSWKHCCQKRIPQRHFWMHERQPAYASLKFIIVVENAGLHTRGTICSGIIWYHVLFEKKGFMFYEKWRLAFRKRRYYIIPTIFWPHRSCWAGLFTEWDSQKEFQTALCEASMKYFRPTAPVWGIFLIFQLWNISTTDISLKMTVECISSTKHMLSCGF